MTDKMTPAQRHYCMSRIHGKGTKPELKVRQWLWRHGYRYRLNVKSVPGKPDIVMRRYRTAIFVNGCFWHGHHVETQNLASLGQLLVMFKSRQLLWVGGWQSF
jgi:DNA mismatch endonuclease Vsr